VKVEGALSGIVSSSLASLRGCQIQLRRKGQHQFLYFQHQVAWLLGLLVSHHGFQRDQNSSCFVLPAIYPPEALELMEWKPSNLHKLSQLILEMLNQNALLSYSMTMTANIFHCCKRNKDFNNQETF
jgi:hypothetical protein